MVGNLLPLYFIWLLVLYAIAAPVVELPKQSISKRATAGPKIDGANFPGKVSLMSQTTDC